SAEQYDRALVPWNILVEREPTDAAVQEAMLAVPHAYASLNVHGRAAINYGRALELFSKQIERVDASIGSIREGRFLKALIREEQARQRAAASDADCAAAGLSGDRGGADCRRAHRSHREAAR